MTDAFQLYAFDYLVKPFKLDRVYQTLNRIKTLNGEENQAVMHKIIRHEKGLDKIIIKNKEGISFVDTSDIVIVQREDRNTVIYTVDNSYITSEGLSELEERLDKNQFFRSHKSYIVNLDRIDSIEPWFNSTYNIHIKGIDEIIPVSRTYAKAFKEVMNILM